MEAARQPPRSPVTAAVHRSDSQGSDILITEQINWLTPELKARKLALDELSQCVTDITQRMARFDAVIPAISILNLRLYVLVKTLFPYDTERGQKLWLDYEMKVQQTLLDTLEQTEDTIRQQHLAAGGVLPPDALEQMADRMGAFRPAAERRRKGGG
jgi:hypothetical protein